MKSRIFITLLLLPVLVFFVACFNNDQGVMQYSLWVDVQGNGDVSPSSGQYFAGTTLTFDVRPAQGWVFSSWSGNNSYEVHQNHNGQWQLMMNGDKNLTAIFTHAGGPGPDPDPDPNPDPEKRTLSVQVEGRGTVTPNSGSFAFGELVYLNVLAEKGWAFDRWEGASKGDVIDANGLWAIVMDNNKSLLAVFKEGNYNLDVQIVGKGTVDEKIVNSEYPEGTKVRLWAKPASGWEFQEWQGDAHGKDPIVNVTVTGNMTVKAIFVEDIRYELTIKKIGQGKVKEEIISTEYEKDAIVRLTAIPASGWEFIEWRGDVRGRKELVEIEMDSDKTVTAVFEEEEEYYFLDVTIKGKGQVEQSPDEDEYLEGTSVTLRAKPDSGWVFKEWSGDASGSSSSVRVTMDNNKKVTATFEEDKNYYKLNVNVNGSGSVTKNPNENEYEEGTKVSLNASPANGWEFQGWSGDASGNSSSTTVTMDRDKNVTATFREIPQGYKLTIEITNGEGTFTCEPKKDSYQEGEKVKVGATPKYYYHSVAISVNGTWYYWTNPVEITMTQDTYVEIYFNVPSG